MGCILALRTKLFWMRNVIFISMQLKWFATSTYQTFSSLLHPIDQWLAWVKLCQSFRASNVRKRFISKEIIFFFENQNMYCTQAKKPFSGRVVKCDGPKIKTNILRRRAAIKTHLPALIFSFPDSNEPSSFTLFIKQNWLVVFSPTLQKPLRTVETMFEERQKASYHGKQTKWTYCNNIVVRNSHVFNGKNIRRLLGLMQRYRKL